MSSKLEDLRVIMKKYNLVMECKDDYTNDGEWRSQTFILRGKDDVECKHPKFQDTLTHYTEGKRLSEGEINEINKLEH